MVPIQISEYNLYPDLQVLLYKHLEKLEKSAIYFFHQPQQNESYLRFVFFI